MTEESQQINLKGSFEIPKALVVEVSLLTIMILLSGNSTSANDSMYLFMQGYICNIIESGVFIRYLGRLTGFSPRNRVYTSCSKSTTFIIVYFIWMKCII